MKKQNKSYQICWWPFWRDLYGRYRNHHISYMMHQVANAVAMLAVRRCVSRLNFLCAVVRSVQQDGKHFKSI